MPSSRLLAAAAALLVVAGCTSISGQSGSTSAPPRNNVPVAAAPTPKSTGGMNARGDVVDSSRVEAGSGQKVTGMGGWEGEITGRPAPNSRFTRLQIGMSMRQALNLVGQPSDQGVYITGKSFIPFYFGADRNRYEMVFRNQGRLIFAGGSLGDYAGGNLIWIIHNPNEGSSR
ncbi:MAG: hypothetical protein ABI281_09685 [Caldimonas sp.]